MMSKYGIAAVEAVGLYRQGESESPEEAWEKATAKAFGAGTESQRKACPRGAFLGLCEEGLIEGIKPGQYTRSQKNKKYAINAIRALRKDPTLSNNLNALWNTVLGGASKQHNSQMDVVIALWNEKLIRTR